MAAGTAANVTTGKHRVDGGIYVAPIGTTLPTDATTALAAGFKNLGYISEDGVTIQEQRTNEGVKEWNGDEIDTLTKEHVSRFKAKFLETVNEDVLKVVRGSSNVTTATGGAITAKVNSKDLDEWMFVIDTIVKGSRLQRRVIPRGKLTELGDLVNNAGTVTAYDATITCYPDANGDKIIEYIAAASTST